MTLYLLAFVIGLALLVMSADKFVDGAAAIANHYGMSPLLIGMVIVGIGTSAPEMVVSAFAALNNNPGLALGNAYGSNISNIALILGITALISPIPVQSQVLRKELPILTFVTLLAGFQLLDGHLSAMDAWVLVATLVVVMFWLIRQSMGSTGDEMSQAAVEEAGEHHMPAQKAWLLVIGGLVVMMASSRTLVWGAENMAKAFGVSDLVIGLTVVAIGTSLPELVSSVIAARKQQHALALGNILGSNLFNTLGVVGIAGAITPAVVDPSLMTRDFPVMLLLTLSLFVVGMGFKGKPGRINKPEGALLVLAYAGYMGYLLLTAI
ncbi:calcium/sodium antiporter [Comamonadaceae bacterium M7527]|nr:calcium/sodium antiporter [Comamonadaceae bacterium M7527]